MILFILVLIAIGLIFLGNYLEERNRPYDSDYSAMIGSGYVFSIVFGLCILISNIIAYTHQINDITELKVIEERRIILKDRAESLSTELNNILGKYVTHEGDVFNKLTITDVNLYAVKYPELKSSKLFSEYAGDYKSLYDKIYRLDLNEITLKRNLERRKRYHIHVITFILPKE